MITEPLFPRRQPCPCGSGKKFKNCCEGSVRIDEDLLRKAEQTNPGTVSRMLADLESIDR